MFELLIPALAAGLLLSISTSTLGCFIVWRKMSYFGDTLAHGALLSIALALIANINIYLSLGIGALLQAILICYMNRHEHVALDGILGVVSHSMLALSLIILSKTSINTDLNAYLFGDILTVSMSDIYAAVIVLLINAVIVLRYWQEFILISLDENLAASEGIDVKIANAVIVVVLALVVAVGIRIVGALLVTALLIIPSACASHISVSPINMVIASTILSVIAVVTGLLISMYYDIPAAAAIIVVSSTMFYLSVLYKSILKR